MTYGPPDPGGGSCRHCGSALPVNAPFCVTCGRPVHNRIPTQPVISAAAPVAPPTRPAGTIVGAGRGVRCACFLMDIAAMLSPALPLATAAAILGVAEIVYLVVPIAFVAVWLWMQIWQSYTGMTFGKSMLGLKLVRAAGNRSPGLAACLTRGAVFGATAGLAALPVVLSEVPRDGLHDRVSGLTMIDTVRGANPLGKKQEPVLRRFADRGLNKVAAPLPTNSPGRG